LRRSTRDKLDIPSYPKSGEEEHPLVNMVFILPNPFKVKLYQSSFYTIIIKKPSNDEDALITLGNLNKDVKNHEL